MDRIITTEGSRIDSWPAADLNELVTEGRLNRLDLPVDGDAPARAELDETMSETRTRRHRESVYQQLSGYCLATEHEKCNGTTWDTSIDEATACDCWCGCAGDVAGEL